MPEMTTRATALKEPPDAAPAQASTRTEPRTAGRHLYDKTPTRPPTHRPDMGTGLRAAPDQRTHPTRGDRHRPPAPTPLSRLPPPTHATRAHTTCRHGSSMHDLACTQRLSRKPRFLHMASVSAGLRLQKCGQSIWHGIGRFSRWPVTETFIDR